MEATRVREEWEHAISSKENANSQPSDDDASSDAYCFELLSMVLALSGSNVGRQYLAQQLTLLQDLFSLLHTASPRVQRQVGGISSDSSFYFSTSFSPSSSSLSLFYSTPFSFSIPSFFSFFSIVLFLLSSTIPSSVSSFSFFISSFFSLLFLLLLFLAPPTSPPSHFQ